MGHLTNRARSYGQAECAEGGVGRATSVFCRQVSSPVRARMESLSGDPNMLRSWWAGQRATPDPCTAHPPLSHTHGVKTVARTVASLS